MESAGVHPGFWDSGLKTLHGLVWVVHWHWLCIILSCFYCVLGGSALRGGFSPLQLWGVWIQPSWWSFAMSGWTDTLLWWTLDSCCQSIQSSALVWQHTQTPSICYFMLTNEFWWILLLPKRAILQWLELLQFFIQLTLAETSERGNFQLAAAGCELQWWRNRHTFVLAAAAGAVISDKKAEQKGGVEECSKLSQIHMKE